MAEETRIVGIMENLVGPLYMTGATADECWPLIRDYHYSKRMPNCVLYGFAVRKEGGLFGDTGEPIVACIFSNPVSRRLNQEALELSRIVRHPDYKEPLSKFISFCLSWLKANTNTPYILSYADSSEGHHGGLYQACGFRYIGERGIPFNKLGGFIRPDGTFLHSRTASAQARTFNRAILERKFADHKPIDALPKYLYLFPLRQKLKSILKKNEWEELPFPKPNYAARPVDEQSPDCASKVQPLGAAPIGSERC